jgi:Rrf2 family nitric oxide-sensitive transcriptional repressor
VRLTRFTDISLRALMYLGAHEGRPVSAAEMSRRLRVSKDHLMKSLQALAGLGLVAAERGRGGGFRPARAGASIRIGGLVRSLERSHALAECFADGSTCPLTGGCRLAGALREAESAFYDVLDGYTVADLLTANRSELVQLGESRAVAHH